MIESLSNEIMICTSLMDSINKTKDDIFRGIEANNIDLIVSEVNNRNRLINIIEVYFKKIQEMGKVITSDPELKKENVIIKSWYADADKWIDETNKNDQLIEVSLEKLKEKTMKEIAEVHTTNEQFKGYDLSNVKR